MTSADPSGGEKVKRPAFQFYPADWRKDVELRSCSIAARGLWIDMMCIAHECEPYGHLVVNGKAMTAAQIAGQVGLTPPQTRKLIAELVANGVARISPQGVLFSKRMAKDEDLRNRRAEGGKAGAEHGIKGAESGSQGGRPRKTKGGGKGGFETPLDGSGKPPPSSSSSSSPSGSSAPDGAAGQPATPDPIDFPPMRGQPGFVAFTDEEKSAIWRDLKERLVADGSATTVKGSGELLGKMSAKYGSDVFLVACREALRIGPAHMHTYLVKLCELAAGKQPGLGRQARPSNHTGLQDRDYNHGVGDDGRIT